MPSGHGQDYADHDAGQARRNGRARVGRRAVYPIAIKWAQYGVVSIQTADAHIIQGNLRHIVAGVDHIDLVDRWSDSGSQYGEESGFEHGQGKCQ